MGYNNCRDVDSGWYNLLFSISGTLDVQLISEKGGRENKAEYNKIHRK